ncbi:MAG: preprotein translocase subunit YajC [Spirochaetia bacterium]|nr:preprotein translocase subunit YajC [Spirochaetia bacterium]
MNALLATMGTTGSATSASSTGSMTTTFITFGLIILIFYFLIIRPQKKKEKETKNMLSTMKKGDKVVSIGGIRGTIAIVKETTVVVKVDDNTRIEFSKNAIAQIIDRKAETVSSSEPKEEKKETVAPSPKKKVKKAQAAPTPSAEPEDAVIVEETPAKKDSKDSKKETK